MMGSIEQPENLCTNLLQLLRSSTLFNDLLTAAQAEAQRTSLRISEIKKGVQNGLVLAGWDRKLRNAVYHHMRSLQFKRQQDGVLNNAEQLKEPLTYVRKAQQAWEKKILKSLNSMCTELTIPLARRRPEKEHKDMMARWTELGVEGPAFMRGSSGICRGIDLSQIRPVYAPKDFLEIVISLQNPNCTCTGNVGTFDVPWGLIQIPLKVKSLNQLRVQYSDMAITQCQTGIDDLPDIPAELFDADRAKLGKKVLAAKHAPISREFAKKGCPVSMRAELWSQILGVEVKQVDILYYEQLKSYVLQHDLLVDNLLYKYISVTKKLMGLEINVRHYRGLVESEMLLLTLIYKDVKLTATNDDQYFVFEDFLYQVLLPFSRDTVVLKHFAYNSATPPKSYIRGKLGVEEFAVTYPPNGVIPFHGFAMYVAPLCYLYSDISELYFIFRSMYMHFFFRLHSVSSHSQGIVALSLLFENLLQTQEPELFYHLIQVGCQPLKIAFKWLMRAFSGFLASDQVLLLWDRIVAYDSLEILPVLAVAIFSFRKTNLMKVTTYNAAEAVLADLFTLQVLPLIQLALFSK